jgi:hypothetical protein
VGTSLRRKEVQPSRKKGQPLSPLPPCRVAGCALPATSETRAATPSSAYSDVGPHRSVRLCLTICFDDDLFRQEKNNGRLTISLTRLARSPFGRPVARLSRLAYRVFPVLFNRMNKRTMLEQDPDIQILKLTVPSRSLATVPSRGRATIPSRRPAIDAALVRDRPDLARSRPARRVFSVLLNKRCLISQSCQSSEVPSLVRNTPGWHLVASPISSHLVAFRPYRRIPSHPVASRRISSNRERRHHKPTDVSSQPSTMLPLL